MRQRAVALAAVALLAACAGGAAPARPAPRLSIDAESEVLSLLETLVTTDTRGSSDSLFAPGATIIANGMTRVSLPRLAGVSYGGQAAVLAAQTRIAEGVAWASLEYRWFSGDMQDVRLGRATAVLVPRRGGGWMIDQLHSSSSR